MISGELNSPHPIRCAALDRGGQAAIGPNIERGREIHASAALGQTARFQKSSTQVARALLDATQSARLHANSDSCVAAMNLGAVQPNLRLEVALRKIKGTELRQAGVDGFFRISGKERPTEDMPDLQLAERLVQLFGIERGIARELDVGHANPIARSHAEFQIGLMNGDGHQIEVHLGIGVAQND